MDYVSLLKLTEDFDTTIILKIARSTKEYLIQRNLGINST